MPILKVITLEELKEIQAKILFSRTDKVSKISDGSVLNGFFFGNAKLAQKALKDIAISQSHYFPDSTYGVYLDNIAEQWGLPPRFGALGSSTYIRLSAAEGTIYPSGLQITGTSGIVFELENEAIVGSIGFTYAKIKSLNLGSQTNVEPYTLNRFVSNTPNGHLYLTNEYKANGGRDIEDDEEFRIRLKNSFNIAATGTLSKIEQIFIYKNPNVLRVFNGGTNTDGKLSLVVVSVNGVDFTQEELQFLTEDSLKFFSMSELNLEYLFNKGVELRNVEWLPIDISFRVKLDPDKNVDAIRENIQINVNKYLDYRVWKTGQRIEWDEILFIVKNTNGVLYVPDTSFVPNSDIDTEYGKLPRIRGFEMRDLTGNILFTGDNQLNPIYYPSELDFNLIKTILRDL